MIGRVLGYTAAAGATAFSASYGMSTEYVCFVVITLKKKERERGGNAKKKTFRRVCILPTEKHVFE
jgi:hypothetical protein